MTSHWSSIRRHWELLGPPLRPPAEAVEAYRRALGAVEDIVLLGVTPELAGIGRTVQAIDQSADMIANIWPGDTEARRATVGDWLDLPMERGSVAALVGDGCLSALGSSRERKLLLAEIARVLRPEGRAVLRAYAGPERAEDLNSIQAEVMAGNTGTFHALKWRIAMVGAAGHPDAAVRVSAILETFDTLFPDREALAAATGWPLPVIGTVDVYARSAAIYSFATIATLAAEAAECFNDVLVVSSGDYPLSARCPLLVLTQPRKSKDDAA